MELFTKDYLGSESMGQSYKKGKDLYLGGNVKNVRFSGNTIYGRVQGSYLYKTEITINSKEDYSFYCSCPYSYGGLCKHQIALGLYVLEHPEIFKTDAKEEIKIFIENSDKQILTNFMVDSFFNNPKLFKDYKSLIKEIEREKTRAEKEKIQEKVRKEKEEKRIESAKEKTRKTDFDKISDKVKSKIELLDLNNYSELMKKHFPENKGFDDFEILSMSADNEIKEELKKFLTSVKAFFILNDNLSAFKYIIEIFFGLITANTNQIDNKNTIYSKNNIKYHILHHFKELIIDYSFLFNINVILNNENTIEYIDILFNKLDILEKYIKITEVKSANNYFELINEFLLMFIKGDEKVNLYLKEKLNNSEIKGIKKDFIYKKLYDHLNDIENWIPYLKKDEYQKDENNMMRILKFYENNKEKFLFYMKNIKFVTHSDFKTYLSNHITKEDDSVFYKKILFELCLNYKSIESLKKLQQNYDKTVLIELAKKFYDEKLKYTHSLNQYYYYEDDFTLFYLDILKEGELFDMIFKFIKDHQDSRYYNEAILIVLNLYPQRCFDIVTEICKNNLIKHVSTRVYETEASRLKNLLNVNDDEIKAKVINLAKEICLNYPRRMTLQEAFSKIY